MIKRIKKIIIFSLGLIVLFVVGDFALAEEASQLGIEFGESTGLTATDPRVVIANIIRVILGFLGIISVLLILYGGFLYMTAAGREEQVDKAKNVLRSAVIGLIIIMSAFGIATFIISSLASATGVVTSTDDTDNNSNLNNTTSNRGGDFYISSTHPRDESIGNVMNTRIKVKFNYGINETVTQEVIDNNFKVEKIGIIDPETGVETAVSAERILGSVVTRGSNELVFNPGNVFDEAWYLGYYGDVRANVEAGNGFSSGCDHYTNRENPDIDVRYPNRIAMTIQDTEAVACSLSGEDIESEEYFDAWTKYRIIINGGDGGVSTKDSEDGYNLDFINFVNAQGFEGSLDGYIVGVGGKALTQGVDVTCNGMTCSFEFSTNDIIDSENPRVGLVGGQICVDDGALASGANAIRVWGRDDTRITSVIMEETLRGSEVSAIFEEVNLDVKNYNREDLLSTSNMQVGDDYIYNVEVIDAAGNEESDSFGGVVRQGHCCNGVIDEDKGETEVDCGGVCGECLVDEPVIYGMSPVNSEGFSSGAVDNFMTIEGRKFGDVAGEVYFYSPGSEFSVKAKLASELNSMCIDTWSESQVVVAVPSGVASVGPIKVIRNDGKEDTTGVEDVGPVFDFALSTNESDVNRPGICGIDPVSGKANDVVTYYGINLNGVGANFGSNIPDGYRSGVDQDFSDASGLTGNAGVPNIVVARTTTFTLNSESGAASNYLYFTKEVEPNVGPVIRSFSPSSGNVGEYITIIGNSFGNLRQAEVGTESYNVYFDIDGIIDSGSIEASFDFPEVCEAALWNDKQIIVKVPDGLSNGTNYLIVVRVLDDEVDSSTAVNPNFVFNVNELLNPGLCKVSPSIGPNETEISLWGEYFGDTKDRVNFQFNKVTNATDIIYWGEDELPSSADRIDTKIISGAITGPVSIVKGTLKSNAVNLVVGSCNEVVGDDVCGGSNVCCPLGSYKVGECVAEGDNDQYGNCYPDINSCVYEWDFSTGFGSCSTNTDCLEGMVCNEFSNACEPACIEDSQCVRYKSDCLYTAGNINNCEITGIWQCDVDSGQCVPPTCAGYDLTSQQCAVTVESEGCPNSPGVCRTVSDLIVGDGCDSNSCDEIYSQCSESDSECEYSVEKNACKLGNERCDDKRNDGTQTCNQVSWLDVENKGVWQVFNGGASCPSGTFMDPSSGWCNVGTYGNHQVCDLCPGGFSCSNNECIVDSPVCPAESSCIGGQCVREPACECCCDANAPQGQDCCLGLTCEANLCNAGDANYGMCTGCAVKVNGVVDQDLSNDMCVCSGVANKVCDTKSNPLGVCIDKVVSPTDDVDDCPGGNCGGAGDQCKALSCKDEVTYGGQCVSSDLLCSEDGQCSVNDVAGCANNKFDTCLPSYECIANETVGADTDDCRCCCKAGDVNYNGLECYPQMNCATGELDTVVSDGDRGLFCGCTEDSQCGGTGEGCSNNTCCVSRPRVDSVTPVNDRSNVCRNALISAEFSTKMNISSFNGRVVVTVNYGTSLCPDGTYYGTLGGQNWCAVEGSIQAYDNDDNETVMKFVPVDVLEPNKQYQVSIQGDIDLNNNEDEGVVSAAGVSVDGFKIWKFITGPKICELDMVDIRPKNWLYQRSNEGKEFKATAISGTACDNRIVLVGGAQGSLEDDASLWVNSSNMGMNQSNALHTVAMNPDGSFKDKSSYAVSSNDQLWNSWADWINSKTSDGDIVAVGSGGSISNARKGGSAEVLLSKINAREAFQIEGVSGCSGSNCKRVPYALLFVQGQGESVGVVTSPSGANAEIKMTIGELLDNVGAGGCELGQPIMPYANVYDWEWDWRSDNIRVAELGDYSAGVTNATNPNMRNVISRNVNDKKTYIHAIAETTTISSDLVAQGVEEKKVRDEAKVMVFQCDNLWPPVVNPATWDGWEDDNNNCPGGLVSGGCNLSYNFRTYYCRDAGGVGTFDDLPAFKSGVGGSDEVIVRGASASQCYGGYMNGEICVAPVDCVAVELSGCVSNVCTSSGPSYGGFCTRDSDCQVSGLCMPGMSKEVYFLREDFIDEQGHVSLSSFDEGGKIKVEWTKVVGVSDYSVYYRSVDSGYDVYNGTLSNSGNKKYVVIDGLENDQEYFVLVSVITGGGAESPLGEEKKMYVSDKVGPSGSYNDFSVEFGEGEVALDWNFSNEGDVSYYMVKWGVGSNNYAQEVSIEVGVSPLVPNLTTGEKYYFEIAAYDAWGNVGAKKEIDTDFCNEEWYLSEYLDVYNAVNSGVFASGCSHYESNGRFEGRYPNAWAASAL